MKQSLTSQTFYHSSLIPSFVFCSVCGVMKPECDMVQSQIMEAIDGDYTNLVESNFRKTDKVSYECHTCLYLEGLQYPPIVINNPHFKEGYQVGMDEAKSWRGLDSLSDVELVTTLKGTFTQYAESPNEEALFYSLGSTIGLLIGIAVFDPFSETPQQGH